MKVLTVLSVVQTLAIAILVVVLVQSKSGQASLEMPIAATSTVERAAGDRWFDAEQLRQVVREELQRHARTGTGAVSERQAPAASHAVDQASPLVDQKEQLELVGRQLEHYRRQGSMSGLEMSDMHMEIAKLDPAARKQMLSALVRAINAGEIRGAL